MLKSPRNHKYGGSKSAAPSCIIIIICNTAHQIDISISSIRTTIEKLEAARAASLVYWSLLGPSGSFWVNFFRPYDLLGCSRNQKAKIYLLQSPKTKMEEGFRLFLRLDTIPFPIIFICEDWCQSAARLLPGASCVAAVQGSGGFEKLLTQSNLEQETSDQSDPASVEADGCQLTLVCSLQCAPVMAERRRSQPYLTRDQNQRLATLRHRYLQIYLQIYLVYLVNLLSIYLYLW